MFFAAATLAALNVCAEIPKGYYDRLAGKTTSELKTTLHQIISPHTEVSSYSALPSYFQKTDLYPESKRWWDMYSDIPFYAPSFQGLNREHSFPKSWWGGATDIPAYVDLNHLYPAESAANLAKNNYPLGIVTGTPTFENGISTVGRGVNSGGAPYVFEPDDAYKGDFARTYFYMVTCYQDLTWKYQYMARNGTYPTLQTWAIDLLLAWHRADPVSQKEIDRNEAIYKIQNNRNPFIDYPELAEYIWGSKMGLLFQPSSGSEAGGDPVLISPVQDMSLDFNEVAVGRSKTSKLYFNGQNLTGSLELTLSGTDAKYFSLASSTIKASLVNAEEGYWLNVNYNPKETGQHSARLRIQDGGLTGSIGVELRGEALPAPSLTRLTATDPTNITTDAYLANWLEPNDETVDYYIVTRTRFAGGKASTEELLAEDNYLEITDFDLSDSETYSVQSVRLDYRSEASNTITVTHSSFANATDEQPLVVECYDGLVRIICGGVHSDAAIYDVSGKCVRFIEVVDSCMDINLAPGVYFITTHQHPSPVKILAR